MKNFKKLFLSLMVMLTIFTIGLNVVMASAETTCDSGVATVAGDVVAASDPALGWNDSRTQLTIYKGQTIKAEDIIEELKIKHNIPNPTPWSVVSYDAGFETKYVQLVEAKNNGKFKFALGLVIGSGMSGTERKYEFENISTKFYITNETINYKLVTRSVTYSTNIISTLTVNTPTSNSEDFSFNVVVVDAPSLSFDNNDVVAVKINGAFILAARGPPHNPSGKFIA